MKLISIAPGVLLAAHDRNYIGSCTIVMAMLSSDFFPPRSISPPPAGPFYPSDVDDYLNISEVAQEVISACMDDNERQRGGWQRVGGRHSLGVFVWSTFSVIDRTVGRSANEGVGEIAVGLQVLNGTLQLANETSFMVDAA